MLVEKSKGRWNQLMQSVTSTDTLHVQICPHHAATQLFCCQPLVTLADNGKNWGEPPESPSDSAAFVSSENWYDRHVLPYVLDFACGIKPVRLQREKIVPLASGRVLEIGIGTGLNLAHYDKSRIGKIVGLDPSLAGVDEKTSRTPALVHGTSQMHRLAQKRIARAGLEVELIGLSAEQIPQDDASFDTVVCTYTLCTIPDPVAALREMRRVLKPGGRLLFCEHGRAPDAGVLRWQDRLTPHWKKIAGGCHLNRDVPALLREAGFHCTDLQTMYLPGPRPLTYNYWGQATPVGNWA